MAVKKQVPLSITLPKHIIKAARASIDPVRSKEPNTHIIDRSAGYEFYNRSIADIRHVRNRTQLLRYLSHTEGPLSTAVHNLVQVASNGYSVAAYNTGTNQFSSDGTNLANVVLSRLNTLYDYSDGFSNKLAFKNLIETMLREAVLTNGVGIELVLSKAFTPDFVQVVPLETVQWFNDEKGRPVPKQYAFGDMSQRDPISLDIPTFWVSRMAGDPADLYPRSMMEAAIKLLIYFEEFLEDIRRVVRQSGHARQTVSLDVEKAVKTAPREVQNDTKKLQAWLAGIQKAVKDELEAISPEEAVILFDTATYEIKSPSFGNKIDYTPMLNVLSGMWATSMKTPPSVLGMRLDSGSSSEGNVETLIFLKSAKGIQSPVETTLSRMLTLSCRLLGADVYVNFEFDPLDLRPEIELESFYTMRQTRILQQLSLGFISDEEAAMRLKTGPRPSGAPKLSGTFFLDGSSVGQEDNLPVNPGDTPVGKTLQPDKKVPRKAGGASQ